MSLKPEVKDRLSAMTLEQKVGQLFVFTWQNRQQAINDLRFHPSGYIRIYSDALSVARDSAEIQELAEHPLIIAADLERGIGGTIGGALEVVTCMALGATGSDKNAFDAGYLIGREASAIGVNLNYAPVLDINSNSKNPVINTRSFGADPKMVARLGVAFAKGLQAGGVLCCGKHFPGHGDAGFDSHASLGSVSSLREQLEKSELLPFREAIAAGLDSIMSAHLMIPALEPEPLPATLSRRVMTDLLRTELGFTGVAMSDAMDMGAVANHFPADKALPMAINAGCDQLIMPNDNELSIDIVLSAVKRGEISEGRLDEAVARILTMKSKIPNRGSTASKLSVSVPEHVGRALEIAREAVTLVSNDGVLPLRKDQKLFCVLFTNSRDSRAGYLEPLSFADHLGTDGWYVKKQNLGNTVMNEGAISNELIEEAKLADVIVLAAYVNIQLSSGTIDLPVEAVDNLALLQNLGKPAVLVSFGSPYIGNQLKPANAYVCGFGATQPTQQAMAEACKGRIPFKGILPVELT